MSIQSIKTYLPLFSGFYHGWFDPDNEIENYIYNYNDEPNELERQISWNDIDFDFDTYQNDVVIFCCYYLQCELKNFGIEKITFENISSPKYYNFSNDSINCEIVLNTDILSEYIYKNNEAFIKYLKDNYTSRDGFISLFSNLFTEWAFDTNNFKDFENCNAHLLGSILQFICENEEIQEIQIFEDWCMNSYIGEYIEIKEILND